MRSALAADEMKIRLSWRTVSSSRFEFDCSGRRDLQSIARVQLHSTELEPVDERPHSVATLWLDAALPHQGR